MRIMPQNRRTPDEKPRLKRRDVKHFIILTVGFAAILSAVTFVADYMNTSYTASSAAKTAQAQREALSEANLKREALRTGSIVIEAYGSCEELNFDNFTGAFIDIAKVDCKARLNDSVAESNTVREKSGGMSSMLTSFSNK